MSKSIIKSLKALSVISVPYSLDFIPLLELNAFAVLATNPNMQYIVKDINSRNMVLMIPPCGSYLPNNFKRFVVPGSGGLKNADIIDAKNRFLNPDDVL